MDAEQIILAGTPATPEGQRAAHLVAYIPQPGAAIVKCDECGCEMWLGPRQQEMQKAGARALCALCLAPLMNTAGTVVATQSLGGTGGSYVTDDGDAIADPANPNN